MGGSGGPETDESAADKAREAAALQKLQLEISVLQNQLSWRGQVLEWLRSGSIAAALGSVVVTAWLGLQQLNAGLEGRANDRFNATLARLSSDKPRERITGIEGLTLFFASGDRDRAVLALPYLITALAVEEDPVVQSAILDSIDQAGASPLFDQTMADASLRDALARNRSLTEQITRSWPRRLYESRQASLSALLDIKPETVGNPEALELLGKLSDQQFRTHFAADFGPLDRIGDGQAQRLRGLATAVEKLVALGGRSPNFSGIYCDGCKFPKDAELAKVNFENAYLARADFAFGKLAGANFKNSDLAGVNFYHADLQGADLSAERSDPLTQQSRHAYIFSLSMLDCANLSGANLSGRPLAYMALLYDADRNGGLLRRVTGVTNIGAAIVDEKTRLDRIGVLSYTELSDRFFSGAQNKTKVREQMEHLREDFVPGALFESRSTTGTKYRRQYFDVDADAPWPMGTGYVQLEQIERKDARDMTRRAKGLLIADLNQGGWTKVRGVYSMLAALSDNGQVDEYTVQDYERPALNTCRADVKPDDLTLDFGRGTATLLGPRLTRPE